ncbi:MAG: protein kinase [Chloroflexi bacterium]|nr:protein kinase [Chloroflexota bacterium]
MQDLSGKMIKGYQLRKRIGAGSLGIVYLAHQPAIDREVAIKVILPQHANHPDFIRRFEMEARLVARLENPHIVPLYDYWREADLACLVMRYLRGGSLEDRLQGDGHDLAAVGGIMHQVTGALAVAHQNGIVHCDLKPANILFDTNDNAYLTDFSIAHPASESSPSVREESAGSQMLGSPMYMAPEQIRGGTLLPQTDVYALGVILYEMLVGESPFPGMSVMAVFSKHLNFPLPLAREKVPELPPALDDLIQHATAKKPDQRPPDAAHFARLLEQALGEDAAVRVPPPISVDNPYKGLRPFEEADAGNFFGRENLVAQLVHRLAADEAQTRFLILVGPSGSGKSSVVKAGLIPALRKGALPWSGRAFYVEMFPSVHPLKELESALLRVAVDPPDELGDLLGADERGFARVVERILPADGSELFLNIDQFEELFTLVEDETERTFFLRCLHHAVTAEDSRLRVVVSLRADFYDRPLSYPGFAELVRNNMETVLPLSEEELQRAITHPAQRAGIVFEPGLVEEIMAEVSQQPGVLPLMQYTLTELCERRQGNTLTTGAYREIGGISGSVTKRADELYLDLNENGRETTRQLFLRLITLGEGGQDTRRRVLRTELEAISPSSGIILANFGAYRLLSFDRDPETRGPTVEVAHEALIHTWGRLRDWLAASREMVRLVRQLTQVSTEWQRSGRDLGFLVGGRRLQQLEALLPDPDVALTPGEIAFVEACVTRREEEAAEEQARQVHEWQLQARARSYSRWLIVVMAVATVIAVLLTVLAMNERHSAESERDQKATAAAEAQTNADRTQSLLLVNSARRAIQEGDPDLGVVLALEAYRLDPTSDHARQLLAQIAYAPGTYRYFSGHTGTVNAVNISPDGQLALSGAADGELMVWDMRAGQLRHRLAGHTGSIEDVRFSPDGQTGVSVSSDKRLIVWDITTGTLLHQWETDSRLASVAYSPDGQMVFAGNRSGQILVWDAANGEPLRVLDGHFAAVDSLSFSPNGTLVVSGSRDGTLIVWRAGTGDLLQRYSGHTGPVLSVDFDSTSQHILSGSTDGTVCIWDTVGADLPLCLAGHNNVVSSVAFSPDDSMIASASWDGSIRIWDTSSGEQLWELAGHAEKVHCISYSPDGHRLISAGGDGEIRLWDVTPEVKRLVGHTASVNSVALSPDGHYAVSGADDGTLLVWNTHSGQAVRRLEAHTAAVNSVAFSPDGRYIASGSADDTVLVWEVESGAVVYCFEGHVNDIVSVAFSPDGGYVLSSSLDTSLRLWNLTNGAQSKVYTWHNTPTLGAVFSPDGALVLSSQGDQSLRLWEVNTGQEVRRFFGYEGNVRGMAFSPDGQLILVGARDDSLILWDVASGDEIARLDGHTGIIRTVTFSPDGRTFLSGADDGSLILHDLALFGEIHRFQGHRQSVRAAVFSPDGRYALSGSGDKTLIVWRTVPVDELASWVAANRYVRPVTCEERDMYLLDMPCITDGGESDDSAENTGQDAAA